MKQQLEQIILDYLKKELLGRIGVPSGYYGFKEKKSGNYQVLDVKFEFCDEHIESFYDEYDTGIHSIDSYKCEVQIATLKGNCKQWWKYTLR